MKNPKITKLKTSLVARIHRLRDKKGKMVAVEPISGKWFIGNTVIEAIDKAVAIFPERIFHILKIGYKVAGMMKSPKKSKKQTFSTSLNNS